MTSENTYVLLLLLSLFVLLTLIRTEAPFLVIIIVVSGTAPQLAIPSALTSAGVILLPQEYKGEVAGLSLRITTNYSSVWPNKDINNTCKKISHCGSTLYHSCIVFPGAHHEWDRIQTFCLCQSSLWWRTSGNHHSGPLWYSCHILPPGR